jgi:hypothetical protein
MIFVENGGNWEEGPVCLGATIARKAQDLLQKWQLNTFYTQYYYMSGMTTTFVHKEVQVVP